jgi:hypothetical protein
MPKPVDHIAADVKALLDNRLLEFATTNKRMSWEEIKMFVRSNRLKQKNDKKRIRFIETKNNS